MCYIDKRTYVVVCCGQLGDPLEARQREEELRGPATMELNYCINSFREAAQSKEVKYDHIDTADKEKVPFRMLAVLAILHVENGSLLPRSGQWIDSFHDLAGD